MYELLIRSDIELRLYQNINGFGIAVVQRLCKTSVKKNLYWELKEKVIEEEFRQGMHNKHKRLLKVYGLDSTKAVRARLIEILMERVRYHKDKFICPDLHREMQSMEVKKSGKVEHSDNSHDDNVFSYLMAMYVWYDGKNLAENFGIRKTTIKTDENIDMEEAQFEDALESGINVDYSRIIEDEDEISDINRDLEWLEHDAKNFKTARQLKEDQYIQKIEDYNRIISQDRNLQEKLDNMEMGVVSYKQYMSNSYMDLPDSIFDMDQDFSGYDLNGNGENNSGQFETNSKTPLSGNLSHLYDIL